MADQLPLYRFFLVLVNARGNVYSARLQRREHILHEQQNHLGQNVGDHNLDRKRDAKRRRFVRPARLQHVQEIPFPHRNVIMEPVHRDIFPGALDRYRIQVDGKHMPGAELACPDRQDAGAGSDIDDLFPP